MSRTQIGNSVSGRVVFWKYWDVHRSGCWSPVIHKSMINVWLLAECKVEEFRRHRYRDGISWREREISLARTNIRIMNTTAGGFPGNYQEIDIPIMHTISLFNLTTWVNVIWNLEDRYLLDIVSTKETKQTLQSVCLYLRIRVVVGDHSVPDPSVNTDTVFIRAINIFTEDPQNWSWTNLFS